MLLEHLEDHVLRLLVVVLAGAALLARAVDARAERGGSSRCRAQGEDG